MNAVEERILRACEERGAFHAAGFGHALVGMTRNPVIAGEALTGQALSEYLDGYDAGLLALRVRQPERVARMRGQNRRKSKRTRNRYA